MTEQAPNIEPGKGKLVYDKKRRTIVAVPQSDATDLISLIAEIDRALIEAPQSLLLRARNMLVNLMPPPDPVTIPRAQYEALTAAADWIRILHPLSGLDILDGLRATGIVLIAEPS